MESRIAAALSPCRAYAGLNSGTVSRRRACAEAPQQSIVAPDGRTAGNGAGGINGGITNGNEMVARVAMKPASSIRVGQETLNFETGRMTTLSVPGRHDACIALRAAVVLEAACAICLADFALIARSYDAAADVEKPGTIHR